MFLPTLSSFWNSFSESWRLQFEFSRKDTFFRSLEASSVAPVAVEDQSDPIIPDTYRRQTWDQLQPENHARV